MTSSFSARFWRFLLRWTFKNRRMTLEEYRAFFLNNARRNSRILAGVEVARFEAEGVPAAWAIPAGAPPGKAALYFHGGGYVLGGIEGGQTMAILMAQTWKRKVLLPEYRLAPERPFPAAVEDALKVYKWLLAQGYDPKDVVFCGDSAGGGLSLAAALSLRDSGAPLPAAILCFSPWTDLTFTGKSYAANRKTDAVLREDVLRAWAAAYCAEEDPANPLISPLHADFCGFPPLFIQVDGDEILLDDSLALARRAQAAGVDVTLKVWRGLWHAWQTVGDLIPESRRAMEEAGQFLSVCDNRR